MLYEDKPISFWIKRREDAEAELSKAQANVSIIQHDIRECSKNIRRLSGYDKIGKNP